jgi:inosine triphosphate pyrophosphatase
MKIEYITSNSHKFEEAKLILSEWELEQINLDLTEIQGDRFKIVQAKAKEAFRILQRPLIVEDVSLCCSAIGGLPGPYIKDTLQKIGYKGLYELIHKYEDHTAQAICVAAYMKPGIEPLLFEGIVEGNIVAPKGKMPPNTMNFTPIFHPKGYKGTWGEMPLAERSKSSARSIALTKLKHFLETSIEENFL